MRRHFIVLTALLLLAAGLAKAQDGFEHSKEPTLEETLAWLKRLDVNYTRPRFHTLTTESLKTLEAMTLGGHTKTGRVEIPANDFRYLLPLTGLKKANLGEIDGRTDEALVHIGKLTSLTHLYLHDGELTDAGMKHLTPLKHLNRLVLGGNPAITDAGLKTLLELKNLDDLRISYTNVSDAGMKMLQELPRLKKLRIIHTNVTDVGIGHLAQIKGLTELHIHFQQGDKITQQALTELQKALPNCQIDPTPPLDASEDDVAIVGDWFYDDLDAGYAQARRTGKPLLIVFR